MSLLSGIPVDQLSEGHLLGLIENKVPEARDLEYKRDAYGGGDADKREFLKDVTALANTAGGHIVIGMAENDGVAADLKGVGRPQDEEIRRLESILLSAVEPRLFGARMLPVTLSGGGYALVIRVPRSWNPPHRVNHAGVNRYYLRHSAGVYEPSVDELRGVFLGGAEAERRVQEFRLERLARLEVGDRGLRLAGRGRLVIHSAPLLAGDSRFRIPGVQEAGFDFLPPDASSSSHRHNLEGLLFYGVPLGENGTTGSYTQVFRDGRVEMAMGGFRREGQNANPDLRYISAGFLVGCMVAGARTCLRAGGKYGASFPIAVMISLLDVDGTRLGISDAFDAEPLDRQDLLFAPVVFEGWAGAASDRVLLPVLDTLWNAYGKAQCDNVRDRNGDWQGVPAAWLR